MADSIQDTAQDWLSSRSDRHFNKLYNRLFPGLFNYAKTFLSCTDSARAVVQKAWCNALLSIDRYDSSLGGFSTWMYRIVRNECFVEKRYQTHTHSADFQDENVALGKLLYVPPDEERVLLSHEMDKQLHHVQTMHQRFLPRHVKIFQMITYQGKTYREVAEEFQININTVKSTMHNLRKVLKQTYEMGLTVDDFEGPLNFVLPRKRPPTKRSVERNSF
jgi:RNA polymerase sigma factor (sigma-70 family)